jgi:CheY-like chemotaxis protein
MPIESTPPLRGKILLLDDDKIIQQAVYLSLRDHGYKILMSGEITDALKLIRTERPDLILVDLEFPFDTTHLAGAAQDGFFLIEWVRRTEETKTIPIFIISGTEPAKYKPRADALGIKVCLQKPIKKEELLAAVQTVFAGRDASDES